MKKQTAAADPKKVLMEMWEVPAVSWVQILASESWKKIVTSDLSHAVDDTINFEAWVFSSV